MSYQTILLVIQGLPRKCETVDRFSTIIGAPFKCKTRCSGVIVDAFNEFWGSAYADVKEPHGGWPAPIKAALQASRQGDEKSPTNQDHEAPDLSEQAPPQQTIGEASGKVSPSDQTKLGEIAGVAVAEHSIQSGSGGSSPFCKSPSTPRKERHTHVSTPPRRKRTSSSPKSLQALGPEPRSPLTDRRKRNAAPVSLYVSPIPKISDKENVGPNPLPDILASVLGKRKMEPTIEDSTGYVRRKLSLCRSVKATRTPENGAIIPSEAPVEAAVDDALNTPSKKRKSEVFAGVVVPTVKEVMLRRRHSAPLKEVADSQPTGRPTSSSATALRKSRSSTRMNVVDDRNRDDVEASPRKKIRTVRSGRAITPIVDFPVAGSGKITRLRLVDEFETDSINCCRNR